MEEKSRIIKKLNNDSTRPIVFNESSGGSESQLRLLLKYLPDESFKNINLILNNTDYDLLEKERINVLWMQHFVNQKEAQNLGSKDYTDKIDYIVFNSNWNFEKFVLDRQGDVVARFDPRTTPDAPEVISVIESELATK